MRTADRGMGRTPIRKEPHKSQRPLNMQARQLIRNDQVKRQSLDGSTKREMSYGKNDLMGDTVK